MKSYSSHTNGLRLSSGSKSEQMRTLIRARTLFTSLDTNAQNHTSPQLIDYKMRSMGSVQLCDEDFDKTNKVVTAENGKKLSRIWIWFDIFAYHRLRITRTLRIVRRRAERRQSVK